MSIKNIIFDLGGVIINIDYKLTSEAFFKHGAFNFDKVYSQSQQDSLFNDYETGKISSEEFRKILQSKLDISISDTQFDDAWNAMLLDLPIKRLEFIMELKQTYNVFLLSNTNEIHLKKVFEICQEENGFGTFNNSFDKEYYSHIIGMRKPNIDSFLHVLNNNNIVADETLFVDDSLQHIIGAKSLGIHTIYIDKNKSIFNVKSYIQEIDSSITENNDRKIVTYN